MQRSSHPSCGLARWQQLTEILLSHLVSNPMGWPGADGMTTVEVLACYREMAARRLVPAFEHLSRQHPDLTEELARFFNQ